MSNFILGSNIKEVNKIKSVSTYNDLYSLEPANVGDMAYVESGVSSTTDKVLFKRGTHFWEIPGSVSSTYYNILKNPIPSSAYSIKPSNKEFFGKSLNMQSNQYDLNFLTTLVGGNTSACTFVSEVRNITRKKIKKASIVIASYASSAQACTYYAKIARKGNGTLRSPEGSFSYVTWNGSSSYNITKSGGQIDKPEIFVSDLIEINGGLTYGESLIIHVGCDGGNSKIVCLPIDFDSADFKKAIITSDMAIGNTATSAFSGSVTWGNQSLGACLWYCIFEYEDESNIINIAAIGDSAISEETAIDTPVGEGWCIQASNMCRMENLNWRLVSLGQGGFTTPQSLERLKSVLNSDMKKYINVLFYQCWSGNYPPMNITDYNNIISYLNQAYSICTSAGIKFCAINIYPTGAGDIPNADPFLSTWNSQTLQYIQNIKAYTSANYDYIDISDSVSTDGNAYNRTDSDDNSHAKVGNFDSPNGQYKQANAIVTKATNYLKSVGYI